jgi:protein arginine kinase activator
VPPHLCQTCKQNPATIHFTEIRNDEKRELHVCESCAQSQGIATGPVMASLPTMLAHLVKGVKPSAPSPRCPSCGISFAEFREKGRLGCPNDYEFFNEHLAPLLEKIHGATEHRGRLPKGALDADGQRSDKLLRLRRDLQKAVKGEQYETAARLRDEIRRVEEGATATAAPPAAPPARRRRSTS